MNNSPIIKCACMFCDCDLATTEGVCYECMRGLHALNEWKDGYKLRMKLKSPLEPDSGPMPEMINKIATGEFKQMNIANAEMSTRIDVLFDLLYEIEAYAIRDVFEGRKCLLCYGVMGLDRSQVDLQHAEDCPLLKIEKLKGD